MEQQAKLVGGKFVCAACGKQYAWKPQLAGKRAKCACGATLVVPNAEAAASNPGPAAAPPAKVRPISSRPAPPPSEPSLDDLYDFAAAEAAAPPPPPRPVPHPVPAAAGAGAAGAGAAAGGLGYVASQSRAEKYRRPKRSGDDDIISKPRDVYLPYALTVAGALAMVAWAMYELGVGARGGVAAVAVLGGVTTIVKTGIILGLALLFADKLGISFGDFRSAVRKLIAVVIVSDAALLWLGTIMDALGASRPGFISVREILIRVVTAAAVISALCHFLFDMDAEETGTFALPLALISLVLGFLLKVAALVVLAVALGVGAETDGNEAGATAAASATEPAAAAPSADPDVPEPAAGTEGAAEGAAAGAAEGPAAESTGAPSERAPADEARTTPAAPSRPQVKIVETAADRAILARIAADPFQVRDARAWLAREAFGLQQERDFADGLYAAGARRVFFDFQGGRNRRPAKAYVELPPGPSARAALLEAHAAHRRDRGIEPDARPLPDGGQRFLVIELR